MNFRLMLVLALVLVMIGAWFAAYVIYRAAEVGELVSPLEPRDFPRLTVVAVGTGGPYENPARLGPSTGIGWERHLLLVDAGRGVCEALRKAKIPPTQPETVLLTNLLPYNSMGLDDLIHTAWLQERESPLRVIGPSGTAELVAGLERAHRAGADALGRALVLSEAGRRVEVIEASDGWSEELDGVRIEAGELPGALPALAWRFERGRRSVVVSGTGWAPDALVAFARGADMLVHEGVYIPPSEDLEAAGVVADAERLEREAALHTSLLAVGELATRAGVSSLMLVRLRPPPFFDLQVRSIVSNSFEGKILVPEDGAEHAP